MGVEGVPTGEVVNGESTSCGEVGSSGVGGAELCGEAGRSSSGYQSARQQARVWFRETPAIEGQRNDTQGREEQL